MRLIYVFIVIGIALVFYLSWEPHKDLKFVWFIPNWLSRWTDTKANEDFRTAVPFVALGWMAGLLPSKSFRSIYRWLVIWLILIGVVAIAEVGQLLIPSRHFSWFDIGWGALGAFVGIAISAMFLTFKRSF